MNHDITGDRRTSSVVTRREFLGAAAAVVGGAAVLPRLWGNVREIPLSRSLPAANSSGAFQVGVVGEVDTFNPFVLNQVNYIYTANLYDTLLQYNKSLQPTPRLASSWDVGPDHSSLTLNLRPNITFQSGDAVTPDAVVTNFERTLNASTGGNLIAYTSYLKQAVVSGTSQVTLKFNQPLPIQAMTDTASLTSIVDPKVIPQIAYKGDGAGPFSFASWTPSVNLAMNRFDHYWDRGFPLLPNVNLRFFTEEVALIEGMQSGTLDAAAFISFSDAAALKDSFSLVLPKAPPQVYDLQLNPQHPPFDKSLVRQGLLYALDRQAVVETILWGFSRPMVYPSTPLAASDPTAVSRYSFDLEKAKAMFKAAGAARWTADVLVTSTYPELVSIAELLASDLAKIGVTLNIQTLDITTWLTRLIGGNFDSIVTFSGVANLYPIWLPLTSEYRLVDNPLWGKKGVPAAYSSAMARVASAFTATEQKAAFAALRSALIEGAWALPIAYNPSIAVMAKDATGVGFTVNDWLVLEDAKRV